MTEQVESEDCNLCHLDVVGDELEWARDQRNHVGFLGICHEKCYDDLCKEQPDTPWTDPISGETDFEEMAEDLGVSFGDDDCGDEIF